tara:strand:- start:8467 stop:8838 length:372 start_codon:yes stop_codon:yes gene_type:complete
MNILIVDDELGLREILKDIIELQMDCNVHTASNGQEALNIVAKEWIDFVIVDFRMPIMNGFEFINQFSASNPKNCEAQIMLLSGFLEEVIPHLKNFPNVSPRTKPIDPDEILEFVSQKQEYVV